MSESEGDRLDVMRHWSDDHDLAEAIETLGNVVSRAGGDGYDALNVLQDVGSAYLTLAERHRGAVAENTKLHAAIVLARMQLDRLPVSPRLLMVRDGLDAALDGQ